MSSKKASLRLRSFSDKKRAEILRRFFKTGPGQYGEGDMFLGVTVGQARKTAKEFQDIDYAGVISLLKSKFHEERLLALIMLIMKFRSGCEKEKEKIVGIYIKYIRYINNWDLIDLSAKHILGAFLLDKKKVLLYDLAKKNSLWKRRIALLATFYFISNNRFAESLKLADIMLDDKEDLIRKAVGWMLREIGKKDRKAEEAFLKTRYKIMPRTMLRYAIERFPEHQRQRYLKGTI